MALAGNGVPGGSRPLTSRSAVPGSDHERLNQIYDEMIGLGRSVGKHIRSHHGELGQIQSRWDLDATSKAKGRSEAWARFQETHSKMSLQYKMLDIERERLMMKLTAGHQSKFAGTEAELQRQAAWSRLRARIDSAVPANASVPAGPTVAKMLEEAAAVGDTVTLDAARRELPAFMAGRRERYVTETAAWLDMQVGPDEAVAARVLDVSTAKDRSAASIGLQIMGNAARNREVPGVWGSPTGREGGRVEYLDDATEERVTRGQR